MIDRESFIRIMDAIKLQELTDSSISNMLNSITPDSTPSAFTTPLTSNLIKVLDSIFCDRFGLIEWWVYETDFGLDDNAILFEKNHNPVSLRDAGELYDYLMEKNVDGNE